ncbi:MAG: DegV family protein, partial [Eggerthellaceae bacterium]|nr:DegV family protein [Eggerthellaceae bacterium]
DVKPLLSIDIDGKLAIRGVSRGRKKGIRSLADYYSKKASSTDTMQTVTLGHANCPKDAQKLRDDILHINPNACIVMCNIGPVIGSHVGPGMIAISFWGKDKREDLSVSDRIARRVKGGS